MNDNNIQIAEDTAEAIGRNLMRGALRELARQLGWLILIVILAAALANTFNLWTDDTDLNGWNRSGMALRTDYKTGVQYLSDPRGGLIRREVPDTP